MLSGTLFPVSVSLISVTLLSIPEAVCGYACTLWDVHSSLSAQLRNLSINALVLAFHITKRTHKCSSHHMHAVPVTHQEEDRQYLVGPADVAPALRGTTRWRLCVQCHWGQSVPWSMWHLYLIVNKSIRYLVTLSCALSILPPVTFPFK